MDKVKKFAENMDNFVLVVRKVKEMLKTIEKEI